MQDHATQPDVLPLPEGEAVVYCVKNPYKQTPNEDGAMVVRVDDRRTVLAVADGMGGLPQGARASELALDAIRKTVTEHRKDASLRAAILNGFERANELVMRDTAGSGTTLAAVEIDGRIVRPYHVGDSEIVVLGQRGRLKLQTVSHSPVAYAVEAGLIDAASALHHEDRHLLTNFVGSQDMRIEVGHPLTLRPRDTLVLGSDGLFDNMHIEEIIAMVRKGPLETAAAGLASTCQDRMTDPKPGIPSKADDMTFIVYRPDPSKRRRGASSLHD